MLEIQRLPELPVGSRQLVVSIAGDPEEDPDTYFFEGQVSSRIVTHHDGAGLTVEISVVPRRAESADSRGAMNAYKG